MALSTSEKPGPLPPTTAVPPPGLQQLMALGLTKLGEYLLRFSPIPLSFLWLSFRYFGGGLAGFPFIMSTLLVLVDIWCCLEIGHYLNCRLILIEYNWRVTPGARTDAERIETFNRVYALSGNSRPEKAREFLTDWFFGAPFETIGRDNLGDWMAWAFWGSEMSELSPVGLAQVDTWIKRIETQTRWTFPPGRTPGVRTLRLSLDPVVVHHRPLVWYAVVSLVRMLCSHVLRRAGLESKRCGCVYYWIYKPAGALAGAPAGAPAEPAPSTPIVFVHGIGLGLVPYFLVVWRLLGLAKTQRRGFVALELPQISQRLFWDANPTAREVVRDLDTLLESEFDAPTADADADADSPTDATTTAVAPGTSAPAQRAVTAARGAGGASSTRRRTRALFIGHSIGSLTCSWMTRLHPERVAGLMLLDPVCFLLCLSDVAHNFLHRVPVDWQQAIMRYGAARELHIAYSLGRHFDWISSSLWLEDLSTRSLHAKDVATGERHEHLDTVVLLSGLDSIVPSSKVREYIEAQPNLKLIWKPELRHAEMLVRPSEVTEFCEQVSQQLERLKTLEFDVC
ncbi:hypothetical protein H696_04792 [Fonticula alba]|uniref:AB hydrolase-1 domain-containing protein n=1 Tax=Fonticula alba TaxID=691883 RepID=A0A058Z2N9_FONAL|nr:hypothetical protein H696_04792 [Fonticula alba]KCV68500.1 hypothetical protein H696_04792 [Fonticula alba]|eukprot:XP_009496932.1 hypothetical protein H696_04792 [Fonticula alba]